MNAIILMAIGSKYLKYFESVRKQFELYAKKCNAKLILCTEAPDATFKRNILAQKMLLPELYIDYEWIAFFDLDILISDNAPSIFNYTNESKAFSAVVDPRETQHFKDVVIKCWKSPEILQETHQTYFTNRGFQKNSLLCGSINGGVFLCQPKKISHKFKEFYFSDFHTMPHEEAMMAYVSQTNNLFYELDEKFNKQIIYEIYSNDKITSTINSKYFKFIRFLHSHGKVDLLHYPAEYKSFVKSKLEENYVLHFSSGLPFISII
jgi:hypothetical protein